MIDPFDYNLFVCLFVQGNNRFRNTQRILEALLVKVNREVLVGVDRQIVM